MTKPKRTYVRSAPHNKVSDVKLRLLKQLRREGQSYAVIADTLGLSRRHVIRLVQQYGANS